MRNTLGGYTLIEVMIFLAISGLLLVSTTTVVGNQLAHTEFRNSMNDVNTKMQQWIDQVVNGFTGSTAAAGSATFQCNAPGTSPPVLSNGARERGANPECAFLGKAIHVNTNSQYNDRIMAYQVIGKRTHSTGGETIIADTLQHTQPIAAIDNVNLSEEYKIPNGTRIISVKSGIPPTGNSKMAGIFTNFNTESALAGRNGSLSLMGIQYPMDLEADPESAIIKRCISLAPPSCGPLADNSPANPWPMQQWQICFGSTRNDERALFTLTSNQGRGITTQLTFASC